MEILTWKRMLLTQHQRKPSFAKPVLCPFLACMHFAVCCLLPCSGAMLFIFILFGCANLIMHWTLTTTPIFPCAVCCAGPAAQLGCFGKTCGSHCFGNSVASFVNTIQLYLVETQARPTPLRSSRAIELPSCHTHRLG
ncbi:TPA: hypothetical protein ACH3X1_015656 [Trebouxia sp. C0004]